jgi:IMP dehydrogenase
MRESVCFEDVLLVPKYSTIESRTAVDPSSELSPSVVLQTPVISAPMDTISEEDMAAALDSVGGMAVIHRYNTIEEQSNIVKLSKGLGATNIGAAVGATGDYLERAVELVSSGVKVICIDIAHGHHILMMRSLKALKNRLGDDVHIMAGNVATKEGYEELSDWGADSVRVGVGGGSICSTRLVSGHGVPTLQSVLECAESSKPAKIIADGGLKTSGDVVKALAAGADFVILGSMLAGTHQTPGDVFTRNDGKKYKVYRGMASADAQKDWRGKSSTPEGVSTTIPFKGDVLDILKNIKGGISSGLSYSGARTISELQSKSEFIKQTPAGQKESFTHILL